MIESFTGYNSLHCQLWFVLSWKISAQTPFTFWVSIEKLGTILVVMPLYVTCHFSLVAFNILSFLWRFCISIILWWEYFLFWPSLIGVLNASFMFTGTYFFRLGIFYSVISLKIFVNLELGSLSASIPNNFRLCTFKISQISWLFFIMNFFLYLAFSLTNESISSFDFSMP